ncbi:MAG: hypothetical protein ACT4QF_13635 [Sporichthyaceae bacterium]
MPLPGKLVALHIGAHKTGTSVLQRYLRENEDLMARRRVKHLRRAHLSQMVGWGDRLAAEPEPLRDRLTRFGWDPRYRTLIGSYENLVGRPFTRAGKGVLYPNGPRNVDALARAVGATHCKVLLSIRPQADFVESYYLQTVHQGGHETFAEWLRLVDLDALSWQPIVEAMRARFGRENVEVVDFRLIREGQEAFLRHILGRIDSRLDRPVSYSEPKNRSVSARGLQMALAANPHLKTSEERGALRTFLQTHFSNLDGPRPVLFAPEQKADLWERYRAEYEDLVK